MQGERCTSIQWGVWAGAGMAASEAGLLQRLRQQGFLALPPAAGLSVLARLVAAFEGPATPFAASLFEWPAFIRGAVGCMICSSKL